MEITTCGVIIQHLGGLLPASSSIGNIVFKHCPGEANKTAHNLARLSYDSNYYVIRWTEVIPNSVLVDVLDDVTLLSF
jgi:hypothetical protein